MPTKPCLDTEESWQSGLPILRDPEGSLSESSALPYLLATVPKVLIKTDLSAYIYNTAVFMEDKPEKEVYYERFY